MAAGISKFLLAILALCSALELEPGVAITASIANQSLQYQVDDTPIQHSEISQRLTVIIETHGSDIPCFIGIHEQVPVKVLFDLRAIALDVGFRDPRLFMLGKDGTMLAEIATKYEAPDLRE